HMTPAYLYTLSLHDALPIFGITVDRLLLFCFHYDPEARSYVPFARNIMRAGGVLVVLIMGAIMCLLWRGERKRALLNRPVADHLDRKSTRLNSSHLVISYAV